VGGARIIADRQVAIVVAYKGQLYLLAEHRPAKFENIDTQGRTRRGRAGRLRMLRRKGDGVSSCGNGVLGNGNGVSLDEDPMTFGEHGSSAETKRTVSTTRVREFRKRQKLGLLVRTIRISPQQVVKLTALGYLDFNSRGDEKAEGIAIEAYLGDSL
jgi:hypothetical protein